MSGGLEASPLQRVNYGWPPGRSTRDELWSGFLDSFSEFERRVDLWEREAGEAMRSESSSKESRRRFPRSTFSSAQEKARPGVTS